MDCFISENQTSSSYLILKSEYNVLATRTGEEFSLHHRIWERVQSSSKLG